MSAILNILSAPWAILPDKLAEIVAAYEARVRGEQPDLAAIEARVGKPLQNEPQGYVVRDSVAIVPVHGVIAHRANLFTRISGGASSELIARDLRAAAVDPSVRAIVMDVDSPGGQVSGTQTVALLIGRIRQTKPVATFADGTIASGAYWIGSAAERVYLGSATTIAGSIGVVAAHVDVSRAEEMVGRKTTEIAAGKYKRIASSYAPLTEEGRADIQSHVDYLYSIFVQDVAQQRGVPVEQVLSDMADGRMFVGQQAVRAGLSDGIRSFDEVLEELASRGRTTVSVGALASDSITKEHTMEVTIEQLRAENPEIVSTLQAEGAESERARILAVEEQALAGHEALVAEMKFDGTTTGPQAAARIVAAERERRVHQLQAVRDAAPEPLAQAPATDDDRARPAADAPIEDRAKHDWDADAKVRAEFGGAFSAYLAYRKAEEAGRARIFKR